MDSSSNNPTSESVARDEEKVKTNMSAAETADQIKEPETIEEQKQSPKEGGDETAEAAAGGWWSISGLLQTAKQKSSEAYEFMRKDLNELKDVVANESEKAVTSTATYFKGTLTTLASVVNEPDPVSGDESAKSSPEKKASQTDAEKESGSEKAEDSKNNGGSSDDVIEIEVPGLGELAEKAKSGLSSLVNVLSYAFSPNYDTADDAEDDMLAFSETVSRWKLLLNAVQSDPQTYCHEPEGAPEDYEAWLMTFNLFDHEPQIEHLLSTVPKIREYHQSLVPSSLSNAEFWQRYFYKVHQLKELEIQRAKQKNALEKQQQSSGIVESPPSSSKQSSVEIKILNESLAAMTVEGNRTQPQPPPQSTSATRGNNQNQKSGASSPTSSEAKASTTSTDDWEKTDIGDLLDEARISKRFDEEKKQQSKDDMNDWEFE